jgi:cell wall-associated NlpC family hydrolase
MSNLKPGDLLSYSGHVAIYAGNGKVVHAVTYGQGIKVTSMYYSGHPYRATRIVK